VNVRWTLASWVDRSSYTKRRMAPAQIASFNSRQPRRYVPYGALWRLAKKHSLRRWRREHAGRTTAHAPKYEQANAPTRASRRAASTPSAARRMSPNTHRNPAKDRRCGKNSTVLDFHSCAGAHCGRRRPGITTDNAGNAGRVRAGGNHRRSTAERNRQARKRSSPEHSSRKDSMARRARYR
jgi:hypothetical protein